MAEVIGEVEIVLAGIFSLVEYRVFYLPKRSDALAFCGVVVVVTIFCYVNET
ncbi:hypothetical protein HD806DRAFT_478957 [Xylariaceae sp. AK1471]|nr:hypothetical protein HD806DRAFT_478957 [Xylariaceae sp. AK1471]